ncbi:hypothetical protein BCR44DRAFT_1426837, partial [Catenaria anguillulae PL171]
MIETLRAFMYVEPFPTRIHSSSPLLFAACTLIVAKPKQMRRPLQQPMILLPLRRRHRARQHVIRGNARVCIPTRALAHDRVPQLCVALGHGRLLRNAINDSLGRRRRGHGLIRIVLGRNPLARKRRVGRKLVRQVQVGREAAQRLGLHLFNCAPSLFDGVCVSNLAWDGSIR